MKILILGASGRIGKELLSQGLERGHIVTALVRAPEKIRAQSGSLRVMKGDPLNAEDLSSALKDQDAVITTLGHNDRKPSTLLTESMKNLCSAMNKTGTKRVLAVSSALLFPGGLGTHFFRFIFQNAVADSEQMEPILKTSELDWTIARPPRLTNQKKSDYKLKVEALPPRAFSISRQAVARFLLDALESRSHIHEIVGLKG